MYPLSPVILHLFSFFLSNFSCFHFPHISPIRLVFSPSQYHHCRCIYIIFVGFRLSLYINVTPLLLVFHWFSGADSVSAARCPHVPLFFILFPYIIAIPDSVFNHIVLYNIFSFQMNVSELIFCARFLPCRTFSRVVRTLASTFLCRFYTYVPPVAYSVMFDHICAHFS